jgi:hypothetical protein
MTLNDIFNYLITGKEHVENLLDALLAHSSTHNKMSSWASATMKNIVSKRPQST